MTTNQQRRFYFPLWHRVCEAQNWRMERGRMIAGRVERYGLAEVDHLYQAIWNAAEALAEKSHRAVTPDDLRHACHIVALGQDLSSKVMTNKQLDRVVALFELLINPNDIAAAIAWGDPEASEKKRLLYSINKAAPFAYIDTICRDRFRNYVKPRWQDLELPQLRQLAMTLRNRGAKKENVGCNVTLPPPAQGIPACVDVSRNSENPF